MPATPATPSPELNAPGSDEPDEDRKLEVTGVQVLTSTLASVSAASVASYFGVAGTVVGAGVVSVVATVGTAVYQHGIRRTSAKLQEAQVPELLRPVVARTGARVRSGAPLDPRSATSRPSADRDRFPAPDFPPDPATDRLRADGSGPDLADDPTGEGAFPPDPGLDAWRGTAGGSAASVGSSPNGNGSDGNGSDGAGSDRGRLQQWREALAGRRWGLAAGVAIVLVASLVAISLIEVAAQRPLSGGSGSGTSIGAIVDPGSDSDSDPDGSTTTTTSPEGEPSPSADESDPSSTDEPDDSGADSSSTTVEEPSTTVTTAPADEAPPVQESDGTATGG